MSAAELLAELLRRGVRLEVVGEELVCRGRRSALTHDVVEQLRVQKPALLQRLRPPDRARHLRLVVAQPAYEANLVRALAELVVADMVAEE